MRGWGMGVGRSDGMKIGRLGWVWKGNEGKFGVG